MKRTFRQRNYGHGRRIAGIVGHVAQPVEGGGSWRIQCQRSGCENTFISPQRQRKYCCLDCRKSAEQDSWHLREYLVSRVTKRCERVGCLVEFVPSNARHRFCSSPCRGRSYKHSGVLAVQRCHFCNNTLSGRSIRARFCDATCRSRSHRIRHIKQHDRG